MDLGGFGPLFFAPPPEDPGLWRKLSSRVPAKLTLLPSEGPSRSLVFAEGKYFVGRDPAGDLVLEDPRVSGRHALFQWTGAGWILVDLRSKNGTFVNGSRITEIPLQDDDWISLGGLLCRFERVSEREVEELDRRRDERLRAAAEARRDLPAEMPREALARRTLELGMELVAAERGLLLTFDLAGELDVEVAAGFAPYERVDERFADTLAAIERTLRTGEPFAASNVRSGAVSGSRRRTVEASLHSLACAPVGGPGNPAGVLYVDRRRGGGLFTDVDLEVLGLVAEHAFEVLAEVGGKTPVRELVGVARRPVASGDRTFLEELERRVRPLVGRRSRRAQRLTPQA